MALAALLLVWIATIAIRGALLALEPVGPLLSNAQVRGFTSLETIWAAIVVCSLCLLAALTTRCVRPSATVPAAFAMGGIIVFAAAVGTGSVLALVPVVAMFSLCWLIGDVLLHRLPPTANVAIVRIPIAVSLGFGIVGLILFLLAALSWLNALSVTVVAAAIVILVVVIDRDRTRERFIHLRSWRPAIPSWFETLVIGIAVGLVAFAMLAAFVPENQSDAVRQHLPIAREIWQSGSAAEFVPMSVSQRPMQGHLLYAVAYGFGGVTAAKLVQGAVGLTAIFGVAGMAWLVAGRTAAHTAAVIFATMPLVLWELGRAFTDLFPVMFTVAAILCVMLWQRDGSLVWLIVAGVLSGFGFATKMNMGLVSVALAIGIVLVGRGPWQWRNRSMAVLTFSLGHVVILPWLVRTYGITGTAPGLGAYGNQLLDILSPAAQTADQGRPTELIAEIDDAAAAGQSGFGRSPLDLVRGLWVLTFNGRELGFPIIGRGEIGFLPLMALPLALLGPRSRATAFLAMTAIASYAGWWLTSYQIARHLLPTLAIVAALGGIGVASIEISAASRALRALAVATRAGFVLGCIAVPFFLVASPRAQLPVDVILGRETAARYVEREIAAAGALAAASAILPPDSPVGYVSVEWEGPQLYTEARLTYFAVNALGITPEEVIASLNRLGVRHFIWHRAKSTPDQLRSTLLSTPFLRDYTRILAGDRNAYLFEVLPSAGAFWGADQLVNLMDDPGLAEVRNHEGPWVTTGKIKRNGSVVAMQSKASISQSIPVTGGNQYLLSARGACSTPDDRAELTFHWNDESGASLGAAVEAVIPDTTPGEQFLWRRAPERAASVSAELAASKGAICEFSAFALYDLDSR